MRKTKALRNHEKFKFRSFSALASWKHIKSLPYCNVWCLQHRQQNTPIWKHNTLTEQNKLIFLLSYTRFMYAYMHAPHIYSYLFHLPCLVPYAVSFFWEIRNVYLCTCENVLYISYNPAPKFITQTRHFPGFWNTEIFPHKHHRKFLLLKSFKLIHDPLHTITCLQNGKEAIKIAYCVSISLSPGQKIKAVQYRISVKIWIFPNVRFNSQQMTSLYIFMAIKDIFIPIVLYLYDV